MHKSPMQRCTGTSEKLQKMGKRVTAQAAGEVKEQRSRSRRLKNIPKKHGFSM